MTTTNKLYIANLPDDANEEALRTHFSACGGVCDVVIFVGTRRHQARGLGSVTMTSPTFALRARTQLDGAHFAGRALRVSDAPLTADKPAKPTVLIAQQFRERNNMTYDLSCQGTPLILRMFANDERCSVEARSTDATDAVVVHAHGATRREALVEALREWNIGAVSAPNLPVDADAVLEAMRGVRAV